MHGVRGVHGVRVWVWVVVCALLCVGSAGPAAGLELVAHRGAKLHAPENTMAAARKAVALGAAWIEVDVRRSADNEHYLMHDVRVDRTTDGEGAIATMTRAEIDALDAGRWFGPAFIGEPVPRVSTLLAWARGKAGIYFDVKDADLAKLADEVRLAGMADDTFFWFGNRESAKAFRALAPDLALKINAPTIEAVEVAAREYGAQIVECGPQSLTPDYYAACEAAGVRIMVIALGRNREDVYRRVMQSPAALLLLDAPDVFHALADAAAHPVPAPSPMPEPGGRGPGGAAR